MLDNILTYKSYLANLHRAKIRGEQAPHKLIFMLAILDEVEMQTSRSMYKEVATERLYSYFAISAQLEYFFNKEWTQHVHSDVFRPTFTNPLRHMTYEPFYRLLLIEGKSWNGSYSLKSIQSAYKGFQLDKELVGLMANPETRIELRKYIENLI